MTDNDLTDERLFKVIAQTIESNASMFRGWLENRPGSWGVLAGKAVIACRQKLGRRLTGDERRKVWHELWRALTEMKRDSLA